LSVRILAKIKPRGSAKTIRAAFEIHSVPVAISLMAIKYIPLYIYIPGTMITMEGTVSVILG
jgi:hypothetical protein